MKRASRTLTLTNEDSAAMNEAIQKNPREMLLSEHFRRHVAVKRWQERGKHIEVFDHAGLGTMPGTIEHNRQELDQSLFASSKRTQRLLYPLVCLEPGYSKPAKTKILSIGPRTEMELLHLVGLGFGLDNITAVDLISSSPWIDLGDMHALPYPDRSFNIVISSWVLNYSNQPQLAIDEMCRVCADGGLVAVGMTYKPAFGQGYIADAPGAQDILGSMQRSAKDIADLIGDRLAQICFQDEPADDQTEGPVMLIARIKPLKPATP